MGLGLRLEFRWVLGFLERLVCGLSHILRLSYGLRDETYGSFRELGAPYLWSS